MAKTVVLERKPLSLSERTYLPQIVTGLKTTFSNMFKEKVTLQYPEQKPILPQNYRGVPTLVKDPNGREKCVSCQLCEFVCPPKAIRITPGSVPEEDEEREHVERLLRNLRSICFGASIADTAKRYARRKRFFFSMNIRLRGTRVRK